MPMPRTVYFDSSVWIDLVNYSGGVTERDVEALSRAVVRKSFDVIFGIFDISEAMAGFATHPEQTQRQIALMRVLSDRRRFLITPIEMLSEHIRCHAHGRPLTSCFTEDDDIPHVLDTLEYPDFEQGIGILQHLQDFQRGGDKFLASIAQMLDAIRSSVVISNEKKPTFHDYWALLSVTIARRLAEHENVPCECEQRGIDALLRVKSVRLFVGYYLSRLYAYLYENCTPKANDSADCIHVLSASATDAFVTNDKRQRKLISRVPDLDLQVMSFREFAENLA